MNRRLVALTLSALFISSQAAYSRDPVPGDYFSDPTQIALARAAADGSTAELSELVGEGVNVNARGRGDMTSANFAIRHGSLRGFTWLIEHGANPNIAFAGDGWSATSIAAMLDNSAYLKAVLADGGDVHFVNPRRKTTPLMDAIMTLHYDNARLLIAAGSDVNAPDRRGLTALGHAVEQRNYELAYDLLKAGAAPGAPLFGRADFTILSLIRKNPSYQSPQDMWRAKVIELLRQQGYDVDHSK